MDTRPPPISGFRIFLRLKGGLACVLLALAVMAEVIALSELRQAQEFEARAVVIVADVVDERIGRDAEGGRTYHVTLGYEAGGRSFRIDETVSISLFRRAQRDDALEIAYLPDFPGMPDLPAGKRMSAATNGVAGVLLFMAVLSGWLFLIVRWTRLAVTARERGERIKAAVSALEDLRTGFGMPPLVWVSYQRILWREPSGRLGFSIGRRSRFFRELQPGMSIYVYRDGSLAWWEGDVGGPKHRL